MKIARRRKGVSLIEALVTLFIFAIGLIAIMALFPLGVLKMADSVRANRVGFAANKAGALAEAMSLRQDTLIYNPNVNRDFFRLPPSPFNAITLPPLNTSPAFPDLSSPILNGYDGPGYPVYVDSVGFIPLAAQPVGGAPINLPTFNSLGVVRGRASYADPLAVGPNIYLQSFSLLDDIEFEGDDNASAPVPQYAGLAKGAPLQVNRSNRFTWGYLLRRPRWLDPSVVEMSVVVYDKRPIATASNEYVFPPVATILPPGSAPGSMPVTIGSTEVQLTYTSQQDKPAIRKGGWILDATVNPSNVITIGTVQVPSPDMQGVFYRVVDVTDSGANTLTLDLDRPIRAGTNQAPQTQAQRVFVIMEGVVEVVEKGPGWKP